MTQQKLTVIGLGLMAGSFAMACKRHKVFDCIQGYDLDASATDYAIDHQIIDKKIVELNTANLSDSDFIVLGTPLTPTLELLPQLAAQLTQDSIVFDLGSVKQPIVSAGEKLFYSHRSTFIGGHPMVGSHKQGINHAHPDLFREKPFVLTPPADKHSTERISKLSQLIAQIGAKPVTMSSNDHDYMAAGLSHIPHLLAITMIQSAANNHRDCVDLSLAGGSFKDMTRVAQSNPQLWHDIFSHNAEEMINWWNQIKEHIDNTLEYYHNNKPDHYNNHMAQCHDQIKYLEQAASVRKSLECEE